ncbi:MAG: hypothetical protein ACRDEB_09515, partial [Chitinophagaceae bacterium]
ATNRLPDDSTAISPVTMAPNVSDKMEKKTRIDTVPGKTRIVISQMQAQVLDTGTQIGKPGDLLLTFTGRGFVFTERNPMVISAGLKFEDTYSNEEGTEFYVVIPAESKARLTAAARGGLQIVNPDNESATFKEQTMEMIQKADGGKKVKLVFTKYAVTRRMDKK